MTLLLLTGCLPDLDVVHAWNDGEPAATPVLPTPPSPPSPRDTSDTGSPPPEILHGELVLDVTSYDEWVVLDLDPYPFYVEQGTAGWDLQVRRFEIALNGGISGDGGVAAAFVAEATLDTLTALPEESAYRVDEPDLPDDEDEVPEYALGTWYHYDFVTHVLTPIPGVHVIRTTEGHHLGLTIHDYYDAAGTSGFLTVSWMTLDHL